MEILKIKPNKIKFGTNHKIVELDFTKFTPLFAKRANVLKSKTKLNPANEGKIAGSKQRGMSRQMRRRPK